MLRDLWQRWRNRRWWVRWIVYGVLPIVAFYVVEDFRGWLAWRTYRTNWEERGDRFELAHYLADPVPDDENFAATPFVRELYKNRGHFEAPTDIRDLRTFRWTASDYETGAQAIRKLCREYPFEMHFKGGAYDRDEAALRMLDTLDAWEPLLTEVTGSVQRPHCDYPIDLANDRWMSMSQHFFAFHQVAWIFRLRALARLRTGDPAGAFSDVEAIMGLGNHAWSEGRLAAAMVHGNYFETALDVIWEGLRTSAWSDGQLNSLRQRLDPIGFQRQVGECLLRERAVNLMEYDRMAANPLYRHEMLGQTHVFGDGDTPNFLLPESPIWLWEIDDGLSPWVAVFAPRGWYWQNKIAICRTYEYMLGERPWGVGFLTLPENNPPVFIPGFTEETPYNFLAAITKSFTEQFRSLVLETVINLEMAQVAIAAERYRLAAGAFPASIDLLVPDYLDSIPADPYSKSGGPIRYEVQEDGAIAIYSLGENGADDGGSPGRWRNTGDLTWRYTLPLGFTIEDYLK